MSVLACTGVCAGYGQTAVVQDVSLTVSGKELVAIIGPNGGGKTTLTRVLTGVLSPSLGQVTLDGRPMAELPPRERARRIAVVSQRAVAPELRALDVVLMGRYAHLPWHAGYGRSDRQAAEEAMTSTHTGHLAERRADTLSGGEWQRVLVARALAQGADIFVLDEPSVGLDPARLIELFDLLEARRTDGAAVLAVLHDVNLAAVYATRLIGLREGRVCFDAPPHAALTTGTLKELYGLSVTVFPHPLTGAPQMCLAPGTSGFVPCRVAGGDAGLGVSESGGDAG